jgi:hypothetical protein
MFLPKIKKMSKGVPNYNSKMKNYRKSKKSKDDKESLRRKLKRDTGLRLQRRGTILICIFGSK